jgi:tricorn protease
MFRSAARLILAVLVPLGLPAIAAAQIDARMFRQPDVSATHIAFVYAGDIWVMPKTGGLATRLTSAPGEELFPRFSPDGSQIAFSANYDGNLDVYVVASLGGDPVRLTHHPMDDRVLDWHPDGKRVLFASSRESGRQRFNQFYLVASTGGLPEKLPVPYGEFASFSPDGHELAYVPQTQSNRTWKRYRGGWAADIWRFNLESLAASNLTKNVANDEFPMWRGDTLYFLSDRGSDERYNIWAIDAKTGALRQVTHISDYDITYPAIGGDDIVFQAGGRLYLLDLKTENAREVQVQVVTDRMTLKPRNEKVTKLITLAGVSPTGKRAVFQARGDVFTVPAEFGPVLDVTRTSGAAERFPTWSPDGKTVAYWSDRSGEYELTIRRADGTGTEQALTTLGPGFRYMAYWSPDSSHVAFVDQAMKVRVLDIATHAIAEVDQSPLFLNHGALEGFVFRWSGDSRWVSWSRPTASGNNAIFVWDTKSSTKHQLTSSYFNDTQPVFDPGGKYLYFFSDRNFEPVYSDFDNAWSYPNATRIVAVPLRRDVPSPLAPKNDQEKGEGRATKDEKKKDDEKKDDEKKKDDGKDHNEERGATNDDRRASDERKTEAPADHKPAAVTIDLDGFEARAVVLPPKAGNFGQLFAAKDKVVYRRTPRSGSGEKKASLIYFDLEDRDEKTVLEDVDGAELTADGKKALVRRDDKYAIVELKKEVKFEKPLRIDEMEMTVDPRAEWRQMFADAYRFERDYFYDPNMHGVDWKAMRDRYAALLDAAVTRWDVNFVLGEFIGELNASHTYRGGGDEEKAPERKVGMLGIDWELANGAYRVKRIVAGGAWDADVRAPVTEPGADIKVGDYILAVNGVPLDAKEDPWAAFGGAADETVVLTVNKTPSANGAKQVTVKCLSSEVDLRFREWIEARRARVNAATGGRVGYVYVQSTGIEAQNELVRQFMAQWSRDGLIVDERFNSGGQIPDRFIELLNRPMLAYWAVRDGAPRQWPPVAHRGPMVMLINGWSGSGGDAFPFYFREAKLGPLVGTRTWGGLIGISGAPGLVDGGGLTVPTFRMFTPDGKWFAEGHGVEPDIVVDEDPTQLAKGVDPQLERAISEILERLKSSPPAPNRPDYERRVPVVPPPTAQQQQ